MGKPTISILGETAFDDTLAKSLRSLDFEAADSEQIPTLCQKARYARYLSERSISTREIPCCRPFIILGGPID